MLGDEGIDFVFGQRREDLDIPGGLFVADVEPELVELVGGGVAFVEPYVAAFRLAELPAVAFGDERTGQGVGLGAERAADEFGAGGDVAPLVRSAHLQFAVFRLIEVQEIVGLQELVGELREREAVARFPVQAHFHAVFGHHVVHRDVLSDFAGKVKEREVLHPVVIVDQLGAVGGCTVEVEEVSQLGFDAGFVVAQGLFGQEVAFGTFPRGVADHARCAADEGQRLVAGALEMAENHDGAQVADMERVGCRVEAHIGRNLLFGQQLFRARHELVHHAAPSEFVNKIHRSRIVFIV